MNNNNKVGIDYGNGKCNIDLDTGIRYGVIGYNTISSEALDDIHMRGFNVSYDNYIKELEAAGKTEEEIEEMVEFYESDNDTYEYKADGYEIITSGLGLFVIHSPYTTTCKFCSPCCPGAGDLDNCIDDGVETYCLGPEWFDYSHLY